MVLMCAIAWMRYCEADKWVRLKSPNKHTEELVWYGIESLQLLLSQKESFSFSEYLGIILNSLLKQPFFCGSFRNLDQRGSNLLTTRRIDIYSLLISRNLGTVRQSCGSSGSLKWRQQPVPLASMMEDTNRSSGRILNLTLL